MRRRRKKSLLVRILPLMSAPLLLVGTSFALFSQNLSIHSFTSKPAYTSSQGLRLTYAKSTAYQAGSYMYTNTMTVANTGSSGVSSWQVTFLVPVGTSNLVCEASVTCTLSGTLVTVHSTAINGAIDPLSSKQFSLSFLTSPPDYTLQDINISGVLAAQYQTINGLSVTATPGKRSKSGSNFLWPYTFNVTNNSGKTVTAWRITTNWSLANGNAVATMSSTVNYTTSATQLIITSKTGIANGSSFQFSSSLQASGGNWSLSGVSIQGIQ